MPRNSWPIQYKANSVFFFLRGVFYFGIFIFFSYFEFWFRVFFFKREKTHKVGLVKRWEGPGGVGGKEKHDKYIL